MWNSMGRWKVVATTLLVAGSWQPVAGARQQTFRSGALVVQVDVRVLKDGRFVTDLGASDFTIKEDGVVQKIDSVVLIGGSPSAPAPSAPPAPAAPAPAAPPARSAPAARQGSPSIWVFVFDTEHLSPGGLGRSRDAIVKFIGDRFQKGDIGGVVFDGKMANNRLTSDHEELKTAAAAVKMPGEMRSRQLELREWPRLQDDDEVWRIANGDRESLKAAVARACNEDSDGCRKADPDMQIMQKAERLNSQTLLASLRTLKAAEALANGLARMPGTKTIVFMSEGFFLNDKGAELRQTVGMAARAGARFYTIDARGLNKGSGSSDIIDQPVVSGNYGQSMKFDTQADGMNSLAVDTGGFAIRNENNFGRALDDIQRDSATYYVVSYTATNTTFDGKYRTIDVGVDRAGAKVRARRGYLAVDPAMLLKPAAPSGGDVAPAAPKPSAEAGPKRLGEESGAKADATPDLPVAPGLIALPDASVPGDAIVLASHDTSTSAVRARIDGGKMVSALSAFAGGDRGAGSGAVSSASNASAELGWAAYQRGDVATATTHLTDAVKAPEARPWVHYALGLSLFAQQRYKEAAASWEHVMKDVPEFEPIYFSLADAYGLQRDETSAIKVLRDAQRRWPNDPEIHDAIGVIQVKRGAIDAAIESFEAATKAAPADALGYFNLGRTLQMRWVKAQRYDRQREQWIGPDDDRKRAAAAYQKYLDLGGPYEAQAKQALAALAWK
jgi:VWFA-related protein